MTTYQKLVYKQHGDPFQVLSLETETVNDQELKPNEAHVRFLYSPINPSDVFTIHGTYPHKPQFPAIPGFEGVVEVVKGNKFKPGDRAIAGKFGSGFWRQGGIVDESTLHKIPAELQPEAAATLIINPCTSYLMVKHILPLQPGDVIIQNGANSAVGQAVIQLAKATGIKTINVIRNRPNLAETVKMLKDFGADAVITDEELAKGLRKLELGLPAPKLALECVGGKAAGDLAAALDNGGTLAVYGLLSGQPAQISQADLIFRKIHVIGFWFSAWIGEHSPEEFGKVLTELITLYISGKLKLPKFRKFPLEQWKKALKAASEGFSNEKVLFQLY